ncbi:MAG: histidinol dehydrogenase [Candidatus Micrarchaeota archaeon]
MKIVNFSDLDKSFFEYTEFKEINTVKQILAEVRANGDEAVRKYSKKFDSLELENFEISKEQIKEAYKKVDKKTLDALKYAAKNISSFARMQLSQLKDFEEKIDGNIVGQKIIPLQKAGCYVPGGRYPLPSTALMCVIPAKIAGVDEIIVCSPKIKPATIVAADIAGASRIFNIGGIQAIAAMAFGTQTVPKVDKIVGPGNKYVTAAKKEVYGEVGIDFLAGPSEVLVIADDSANPAFIAADLLAQAEHDPNARADLITTSKKMAQEVNKQLELQLPKLKTKEIALSSLGNGRLVLVDSLEKAVEISNLRAPEHLELQVSAPDSIIGKLKNYGSLFIGKYCAEVFGDYCSGTNHTLPTSGAAKYTGGLSAKDFVKILTYQKISKEGAGRLIDVASKLAEIEGLDAHKKAAEIRREK